MNEIRCDKCNKVLEVGDFPFCPHPQGKTFVNGDEIPGGLEVKHGICWPDGTPRKFYSKSEIRKAAAEVGLTIGGETPKLPSHIADQKWREAEAKGRKFI